MISHTLLRDDGVLLLHPEAPLEASDFQVLASEVDPYIAEHGKLQGLMLVIERFPGWRNFAGFRSQVRFIRRHFAKIRKVAAVTDNKLIAVFQRTMAFLLGRKYRRFGYADRETALAWLRTR